MTVEPSDTVVLYELDSTASAAVIEQAVELRTTVRIFADSDLSVVLMEGALTNVTDEHLWVSVTRKNTSSQAVNVLAMLQAEFTLGKVSFVFDVTGLDEVPDCDDQSVQIPKPATVAVTERRRSRRRRLHDATDLMLTPIGCGSCEPIRAALLNVSPDGLACRVPETAFESIASDGLITASFALSARGPLIELIGRTVSRTEAGTSGHLVIGLEFEKARQTKQRSLLRQALQDSVESISDNE